MTAVVGCGDSGGDSEPFTLRFAAVDGTTPVGCNDTLTGFGPDGSSTVGVSDLRFYVSNLRFIDSSGNETPAELDPDEFQYTEDGEHVALIDLTDTSGGSCASNAIAFSEGTARTNVDITGTTEASQITGVAFDVGLPQKMMKNVVRDYTAEGAPSPLAEMYWSWATGYRHFVMNFQVKTGSTPGEGYAHVGSRDCGGDGVTALTDREQCGFVNTPSVRIEQFDPTTNVLAVNVRQVLADMAFRAPIYDTSPPYAVVGEGPGVSCHSAPEDVNPDCGPLFRSFGLDGATGLANAQLNQVIVAR